MTNHHVHRQWRGALALVATAALVTACGDDGTGSAPSTASPPVTATSTTAPPTTTAQRTTTTALTTTTAPPTSAAPTTTGAPTTAAPTTTTIDAPDPAKLQAAVDQARVDYPAIPGIVLHLLAPEAGIDIGIVSGESAPGVPITEDATFRLASNTKTFTAATVLRLVEQGKVDLDGAVTQCLDPDLAALLAGDGYDLVAMTVRQALTHTSGLADLGSIDEYQEAVMGDPTHRWTRQEQLQFVVDHSDPAFAPGEANGYSDTGYIVLGAIVECASGLPMAQAYRQLLSFDELGLGSTYLESLEPVPATAGERAHQYYGDVDLNAVDPSFNLYGNGGLVSSTSDLAVFSRALLLGKVFDEPTTLATMEEVPATNVEDGTAMGLFRQDVNGMTCWSHDGAWGTFVFMCPDADVTVTLSVQQGSLEDADFNPILFAAFEMAGIDL